MATCVKISSGSMLRAGFSNENKKRRNRSVGSIVCSSSLTEQYKTLRIQPGASEQEVKKAFRQLALQYHPDVCKGNNCGVHFNQINEAYDILISNLREPSLEEEEKYYEDEDEGMRGMYDSSWDLWEEWMGWEGAGIRDYSSHINPYI